MSAGDVWQNISFTNECNAGKEKLADILSVNSNTAKELITSFLSKQSCEKLDTCSKVSKPVYIVMEVVLCMHASRHILRSEDIYAEDGC